MNKNRAVSLLGAAMLAAGALLARSAPVLADEMESSLMRGGLLYDNWYKTIGERAPGAKHPLYPAEGGYASKPGSTWRCKECHGWDYKGKDGAYAKGKHATGIKGIRGMDGGDPAQVVALLKGEHGYGDKLSDENLQDLANFVTKGQADMDAHIDPATKAVKGGNAARGAAVYNTICAKCHGLDGKKPNDMPSSLGKYAAVNPWELMHKTLNGQPDEQMPAMRALDIGVTVDVLSHISTLPE